MVQVHRSYPLLGSPVGGGGDSLPLSGFFFPFFFVQAFFTPLVIELNPANPALEHLQKFCYSFSKF